MEGFHPTFNMAFDSIMGVREGGMGKDGVPNFFAACRTYILVRAGIWSKGSNSF